MLILLLLLLFIFIAFLHITSFIFIVQYYLNLQQQSFLKTIKKTYNRLLLKIYNNNNKQFKNQKQSIIINNNYHYYFNKMFEKLQKEIDNNNKQLTRYMTIIFLMSTMVTTYTIYLCFMTKQLFIYQCLYCMIGQAQINTLSIIIIGCKKIYNNNQNLLQIQRKCLLLIQFQNNIHQQLFKVKFK